MGDLSNPFYYKVAAGIESELGRHGFALVVATTDDTTDGEERVAEALLAQRVSALLIIPVASDQSHLEGERQLGTPVIAIDRPARNLVADSVILQNRHGAYTATAHLLAQGHRRIAYACNPADVFTQMERLRGYRDAMAEYGIRDTADLEFCADDPRLAPESLVGELLDHADPATAVVTGNNRMTIGALRAFRARPGREAPALVGFDDFDTADILGVSVVTYDPVELGRRAAQLAMERVADPSGFSQQIELPTWLVPRGSGERRPSAGADR
jgi:LacI family transcriptional regulator